MGSRECGIASKETGQLAAEADTDLETSKGGRSRGEIVLADRFRILAGSPIAELDHPGAPAFSAEDLKNPTRRIFIRLCEPGVFPRVETMFQLKNLTDARVMHPLDWGPVYWPADGCRRFATIFDRPSTDPLMRSLSDQIKPLDSETLLQTLVAPALGTFQVMLKRGLTHRAIRPDNMFSVGGEDGYVSFGDCVSSPAGWGQSAILEPIELGMVARTARGNGMLSDDLYALGVSIMFLSLGHCPVAGMQDRDIIAAKAHQGSFTALLSGERPPVGLRDMLRGLLCDDLVDRWGLEDLDQYLNEDQRRTVSVASGVRADRPFEFDGENFKDCRLLADAFGRKWQSALKAMAAGEFEKWANRSLTDNTDDEHIGERISSIINGTDNATDPALISKISIALDPYGPLRYKDLILMPDGIGAALADAVFTKNQEMIQLIAECVTGAAPLDWLGAREKDLGLDAGTVTKSVKLAQQILKYQGPGYGIERSLYDLNAFVPCMSKMLDGAYIYSLSELIPALEAIVAEQGELPVIIDRHVVAFIAARLKGHPDRKLTVLEDGGGKSTVAKLGFVNLLGDVQKENGPETAPHLTRWFADKLKSSLDQFKSRSLRDELRRKLDGIVETGRIDRLFNHLNDPQAVKRDQTRRLAAQREFSRATTKIAQLDSEQFADRARRTGWRLASGISGFISFLSIVTMFLWS